MIFINGLVIWIGLNRTKPKDALKEEYNLWKLSRFCNGKEMGLCFFKRKRIFNAFIMITITILKMFKMWEALLFYMGRTDILESDVKTGCLLPKIESMMEMTMKLKLKKYFCSFGDICRKDLLLSCKWRVDCWSSCEW